MREQNYNFNTHQPASAGFANRLSHRNLNLAWLSVILHALIFLGAGLLVLVYLHRSAETPAYQSFPSFGENMQRGGEFSRRGFSEYGPTIVPFLAPFLIVFFAWGMGLVLHFLVIFFLLLPNRLKERFSSRLETSPNPVYPSYPPNFYNSPYQPFQTPFYRFENPEQPLNPAAGRSTFSETGWPPPFEKKAEQFPGEKEGEK